MILIDLCGYDKQSNHSMYKVNGVFGGDIGPWLPFVLVFFIIDCIFPLHMLAWATTSSPTWPLPVRDPRYTVRHIKLQHIVYDLDQSSAYLRNRAHSEGRSQKEMRRQKGDLQLYDRL